MHCSRRAFLTSLLLVGAGSRSAGAALARGLTLDELVRASAAAIVGTALEAHSEWATFGKNRVIVTDTRVRIEDVLLGGARAGGEVMVRVLGGSIGELGERVDGQAELVLGAPSALFLMPETRAVSFVVGAAQGHFRLEPAADRVLRLAPSPRLPHLLRPSTAAVSRLRGRTVAEARELVRASGR